MRELLEEVKYQQRHLVELQSQLNQQLADLKRKRMIASKSVELVQQTSEVLRIIQDEISKKTVTYLNEFLSRGLGIVFPGRGISAEILVGDRSTRKTAEVEIKERVGNHMVSANISQAVGGGVQVVVAFLIQVLVIINRDLNRTLFVDEFFTQVSVEHTDGLFDLFDMLVKELDFKILLITHDTRFIQRADRVYRVSHGGVTEVSPSYE